MLLFLRQQKVLSSSETIAPDKGKLVERQGRKAVSPD
jgi:hypothetical protein